MRPQLLHLHPQDEPVHEGDLLQRPTLGEVRGKTVVKLMGPTTDLLDEGFDVRPHVGVESCVRPQICEHFVLSLVADEDGV